MTTESSMLPTPDPAPPDRPVNPLLRTGTLVLWAVIFGIIAIRLGVRPYRNSVFPLFYDTGNLWNAGGNAYLRVGEFRYSPLVAGLFGLLSRLPYRMAQYVWMGLNLWVLMKGVAGWMKVCAPRALSADERWIIALLVTPLMLGNINNLQANPLMVGLMLLALVWTEQGRWWLAAFAIAAATLLKLYPLALGLILLLHFPRQLGVRLLVMLALGAVLPFLFQSPDYIGTAYQQWARVLVSEDRSAMGLEMMYQDAAVLWVRIIGPVYPPYYRLWQASTALLVGATAFWAIWWHATQRAKLAFLWTLLCIWILLAGPSTESATYIVGALPAAWLLIEAWHGKRFSALRLTSLTAFVMLLIGTGSSWLANGRVIKMFGWQPEGVFLMLAAVVLWCLRRKGAAGERRRSGGPPPLIS